jgi:hypothetical protein
MTKTIAITAEQAPLPTSIPVIQRPLSGEVRYPCLTWFGDRWAGKRDSKQCQAMLDKDAQLGVTPWMRGLRAGFLAAVARDRRDTIALQAPLRDEAAKAIARYHVLTDKQSALRQAVVEAQGATTDVDASPASAGEAHDKPEHIRRRRQKEADARVATARGTAAQAEAEAEHIKTRVAELEVQFNLHEEAHHYRIEALRGFYTKRQAVYVRRALLGLAREGEAPRPPDIDLPDWPASPFPSFGKDERDDVRN